MPTSTECTWKVVYDIFRLQTIFLGLNTALFNLKITQVNSAQFNLFAVSFR